MAFLDSLAKSIIPMAASAVPGLGQVLGSGGAPQVESQTLGDPLPGNTGAPTGPMVLGSSGVSERRPLGGRIKEGLKKFDNVLGSDTGRLAQNIGGQFLGDFRQQRNTKKHQEFLKGEGLNPWEAATGARGVAQAPSTSMGASPASISRSSPGQKKVGQELLNLKAQRSKIDAEARIADLSGQYFLPLKWATIGPENMKAMLASFNSGLTPDQILRGYAETPEQAAQAEALLAHFLEITGASGGAIGWMELLRSWSTGVADIGGAIGNRDPVGSVARKVFGRGK